MTAHDYQTLLRPRARGAGRLWGTILMVAAVAGWGTALAWQAQIDARHSEALLRNAHAQRSAAPPPQPTRTETDLARRWHALAVERAYSWYPVFRALEQASSPDIELLEFLPDKASGKLVLRGEARSVEALTAYLALLSDQKILTEVHLAHQKNVSRAGLAVMTFEIRASLR